MEVGVANWNPVRNFYHTICLTTFYKLVEINCTLHPLKQYWLDMKNDFAMTYTVKESMELPLKKPGSNHLSFHEYLPWQTRGLMNCK